MVHEVGCYDLESECNKRRYRPEVASADLAQHILYEASVCMTRCEYAVSDRLAE